MQFNNKNSLLLIKYLLQLRKWPSEKIRLTVECQLLQDYDAQFGNKVFHLNSAKRLITPPRPKIASNGSCLSASKIKEKPRVRDYKNQFNHCLTESRNKQKYDNTVRLINLYWKKVSAVRGYERFGKWRYKVDIYTYLRRIKKRDSIL